MEKTWQELTLEYAAQGLRPCEIARKVEAELGLETNMYDRVYFHIRRHYKKETIPNTNNPTNKKEELIDRIDKLTPEQFELLIALYSQQEQEFVQASQSVHQTCFQPSA